ncbi:MAG: cysteine desulfurase [Candidatus Dormibacteraeota bacterium]|nr:cysteine desulfurase [Candidatus Dormibacteraeota bacterium]
MQSIYLDHAATTPVHPQALEAMLPYLRERYGNPSSVHGEGRAARNGVDAARDRLALVLDCAAREIIFTGSGTEADNLAVRGMVERWGSERGRHIVVSAIEHDAVLNTARRLAELGVVSLDVVSCDRGGRVDPDAIASLVRQDTLLVSVMLVNNETGTSQDLGAIVEAVHRRNDRTFVHTDAAQALGRVSVLPHELGVDLMTLAAHKVYGPKGVGALWARDGAYPAAQLTGGGQERGRRSATENTAGIAGFAAAAELAAARMPDEPMRQAELCRRLTERVRSAVAEMVVTGDSAHRAAGFATFAFPGVRTDVLLTVLDGRGVQASGGSACSSGAPTPSHVLAAMGYMPDVAAGALRCTTGIDTSPTDIDRAGDIIAAAVAQVRGGRAA